MLWGFIMLRKRYGWRDIGLAVAITGGCFVFFTLGPTASRYARPGQPTDRLTDGLTERLTD
jgi:hypothetical protein